MAGAHRSPVLPDEGRLLIIDLEATCWAAGEGFPEESEIIEIGAVMADAASLAVISEFSTFVKPVLHPELSEFCRRLTSIRQVSVDDAPVFPEAMAALTEWTGDLTDVLFASWGAYDRNQFHLECSRSQVAYPFGPGHLNLKVLFSARMACRPAGLSRALAMLGLEFDGTHHRALDDTRNILRVVRALGSGPRAVPAPTFPPPAP